MKRPNRLFLLIIVLVGIFVFAVGCDKVNFRFFNASNEDTASDNTSLSGDNQDNTDIENTETSAGLKMAVTEDDSEASADDTAAASDVTPTPEMIQPTANVDLPIYIVDADKGVVIPATAVIPEGSDITKELIVENVVNALADQSIIIDVIDVTEQGDAVIVNFSSNNPPYKNLGSGYEAAILDAIAQSLIDNLDQFSKVIYRIDGGAYVSGVYEYGVDDAYFTR